MLYLNRETIAQIADFGQIIAACEQAMEIYMAKQFKQPDRITVNVNDDETYLYMPCFTEQIKGTKILTLSTANAQYNLPTIQGLMLLNNPQTGQVEAILDGASITAYRTGAVGACGIKYTTPPNCRSLAIIGAGVQGYYQTLYAAYMRPLEQVYIYDISPAKAQDLADRLSKDLPHLKFKACANVADAIAPAEIIITVTPSLEPAIPNDAALIKGKHFIGIGSYKPTMHEYPPAIYGLLDKIYIDVEFALEESGDLITPLKKGQFKEENIIPLIQAIKAADIDYNGTTFYKSVGMALFDIMVANTLYQAAKQQNLGQALIT